MDKIKLVKCKVCGNKFQLFNSLRPYCSYDCGAKYATLLIENKRKKESKEMISKMKENLLKFSDYIKLFQITFNTFIRLRDKDLPCISCGRFDVEEFHCGHYIPSTFQYHRFNEFNCNKQCSQCNTHLRGNLIAYRINLIKKIGLKEVEYLEDSRHMMLELTIPEIKELISVYKSKIKLLK